MPRSPNGKPDPDRQRRLAQHYLRRTLDDGARLQRTAALAAATMNFPVGQINILDDRFQYTISDNGSGLSTLPREESVCAVLVDDGAGVLAVDDLRADERFRDLPTVRAGGIVSYLGVPLWSREATIIGTLCVIDDQPRRVTEDDVQRLTDFAAVVTDQLEVTRRNGAFPSFREVRTQLAEALAHDEIVPFYQPVFHLGSGRRLGFEALARWRRADGTVVSPDAFVGAAEDSDLVIDLDQAIVRAALHDLARWRRSDPGLRVGVNLSTRHLELPGGVAFVQEAMADAGVDPTGVVVEITETRLLGDLDCAAAAVRELQAAGIRVVLDDFANGWSNLDWLMGLGADGIKIDRSVTTSLGTRVGDAVCRAVAGLAAELELLTTIEGIDDEAHLAAARAYGFNLGQGYHWSPPVPSVAVDATV